MRKKMFSFKNFVMLFMAIGLLTSIGCSKQDNSNEEVDNLKKEVATLKADLLKDFEAKINEKTKNLQDQLNDAKAKLDELSKKKGVTPEELKNAIEEVKTKTVTKVAFDEYTASVQSKIENAASSEELTALETRIKEGFESRFSALETLAGKNKQGLKDALKKLEDEYASNTFVAEAVKKAVEELETKIGTAKNDLEKMLKDYATKASVDANTAEITKLNNKFDDFVEKNNLGVEVASFLNARLTSLVLLPDYVSDGGGALPVIYFTSLTTLCESSIVPVTEVRYMLNPSTVTEDDIDKDGIVFKYNDPKIMSRGSSNNPKPMVKSAEIKDGVLTVKATIDVGETWIAKSRKTGAPVTRVDQLMLQVPVKVEGGKKVVVNSDWAKVDYGVKEAAIARKPKDNKRVTSSYILKETFAAAKLLPKNHETVVNMAWNQEVNMDSIVKSVYSNFEDLKLSTYGLEFAYDLNDEKGEEIVYTEGTNKTDQQEFTKLEGSRVSTRVYGKDGNEAAVGRTPIVHVMLKNEDCIVKHGFVKFNIVDQPIVPVDPVKLVGKTHQASCGDAELYRVGTKEMNEKFYHEAKMSKTNFHKFYDQLELISEPESVGTVTQVTDPNDDTSYNLVYTLTEDEVWANVGKTVSKKARYFNSSTNAEIIMEFSAAITKETVVLNITSDNYWYKNHNYIIHNSSVPPVPVGTEKATFANNIAQAFVVVDKDSDKTINLNNAVTPADKYKDYTYEFIFDEIENQPIQTVKGHEDGDIKIIVTDGGKKLKAKQGSKPEQDVATIKLQSKTDGDVLEYAKTDLAKWLLNKDADFMKARVVLVVKNNCSTKRRVDVEIAGVPLKDRFDIHFLRPVNLDSKSTDYFVDAVDKKSQRSLIDIKKVINPYDWREVAKIGTKGEYYFSKHPDYYSFYGITGVTIDIDNIKLKGYYVSGKEHTTLKGTLLSVTHDTSEPGVYPYGRLKYVNNGNNLRTGFTMKVPVKVSYLWGDIETEIEVEVKPTSATARKAAK